MRSRPNCHVLLPMSSSWKELRCAASNPHRTHGLVHPLLEAKQILVAEPEPTAHRVAASQVEHLGRGEPRRRELEHLRQDRHDRIGLTERTVGEADLECVDRVVRHVVAAERRLDQRSERLDVRTHDDDVAGLESDIVLEQVQDRVAQHLDLATSAVAGVDADAVVVRTEQRPPVHGRATRLAHRGAIGSDVVLYELEQSARMVRYHGGCVLAVLPARPPARAASPARHAPTTRGGDSEARPRSDRRCEGRSGTTGPTSGASRSHNAGDGCNKKRCTSRRAPMASRTSR